MEQIGFQAVIGDLQGYLNGAQRMQAANEALTKSALASAAAAAKQSDTLVASAASAAKAAAGTTAEADATAKLVAAQQASVAAHNNAAAAVAKAESGTTKFVSSLKAAASAAAVMIGTFVGFQVLDTIIGKTQTWGNEVYSLQQKTGLTAESISGLLAAGDKLGVGFDKISAGLGIFARNMTVVQEANDGFTGGAKTTTELLTSMGIKVLDVNGKLLPMQTLLNSTADWFAKTSDATIKAGVAAQLFSRNGAALLPILNLGSKGMADVTAEAKKLGLVLSQDNVNAIHSFTVAQNEAKGAMSGLEVQVGTKLLPVLTKMFNFITDHQREVGIALAAIAAGFAGIGVAAVAAAIATNAALAGIPILLAALVAGTVALVENWQQVKTEAAEVWGSIPGPIKAFLAFLETDFVDRAKGAIGLVLETFNLLKEGINVILALLHGNWAKAWDDFKAMGATASKAVADSVLNAFGAMANLVIKLFQDMANKAIDALNSVGNVKIAGHSLGLGLIPNIDLGTIQGTAINLEGILNKVSGAFSSLGQSAGDATDPLAGVDDGLNQLPPAASKVDTALHNLGDTLAYAAEQAVQAAQQALFAAKTQEEAQLELQQAQGNLQKIQAEQAGNAQIDQLNAQLQQLQDQAAAADQAQQDQQANAPTSAPAAPVSGMGGGTQGAVNSAAQQAHNDAQRALQALQDQLDATKKAASDMQTTFLKQNEALQQQIQEAVGRGDTNTALGLVNQQRALTSNYRQSSQTNTDRQQDLTLQITAANRQLQALQATTTATTQATTATAKSTTATTAHTTAVTKASTAYAAQEKAIKDHITAIQAQIKQAGLQYQSATDQLAVEKARKDVESALITVQDHSLLTDAQQAKAAQMLAGFMDEASSATLEAAKRTGYSLVPAIDTAAQALDNMYQYGITYSTAALKELQKAALAAVDPLKALVGGVTAAASAAYAAARTIKESQDNANKDATGQVHPGGGGFGMSAEGGVFSRPTLTWVGETFQKEAIIPLERPSRAREILAHIPPGLLASIMPGRRASAPHQVFGDLNVQGFTLEDMEAAAHRQVTAAFRGARTNAYRQGALIGQGVGAGSF